MPHLCKTAVMVLVAALVAGCSRPEPERPRRPSDVVTAQALVQTPPAPTKQPPASPADSWGRLHAPAPSATPMDPVADIMLNKRLSGASPKDLADSINAVTTALPEDAARGFQAAVRALMVASLPLEGERTDEVIWSSILPVLDQRTPWEVIAMANTLMQQLPEGEEEVPFDQ